MPKNINDLISDKLTIYSANLLRVDGSIRREVLTILKNVEKELIREMVKIDPTDVIRDTYRQQRLTSLLTETRAIIKQHYKDIVKITTRDYKKIADLTAKRSISEINTSIGIDVLTTTLAPEVLTTVATDSIIHGAKSADWWSRQAGNLDFKFANEMRNGMARGESIGDLVRRVRGRREFGFNDGIMKTTTREAEGLVRTSVIHISNEARLKSYQNNSDVIRGIKWASTLDSRTTTQCKALDGLVWDLEYKPIGHSQRFPGTTAHWNCRSNQVPVLKHYDNWPGEKKKRIPESKRASIDGQVSSDLNYNDFLKGKPQSFQIETLGRKRWELWKSEKLSMTDLVDQFNNPLTVEQLEAKFL